MDVQEYNPEQALTAHEKLCGQRYESIDKRIGAIMRILATAGMVLVGLLSWSMKAQYEGMQKQVEMAQQSAVRGERILEAVQHVQGQVAEQVVPKLDK